MKNEFLLEKAKILNEITRKYEFKTILNSIDSLNDKMNDFNLSILFVGEFSAGKSAMINAFLNRDVLKENLRPETAIAGELVYDTNEYIEAVKGEKSVRFELDEESNINVNEFDFLIWHLNCDALKKLKGNTIVDMPGFNSGIHNHNKALMRYIGKGNTYVLVIDSEVGSIKKNMMQFIDEINNYDNNMAIAITKTDLKIDDDIKDIEINITDMAKTVFDNNIRVISTSKYDKHIQEKLLQLFNSFDENAIYLQEFIPQLFDISTVILDSLEIYKRSIRLDVSAFEKEIKNHEKSKELLIKQLENKNVVLQNKFTTFVVPSIINDVRDALQVHSDELVSSLKAGKNSFLMTVNNILRPILISSTQNYVEESFEDYLNDLSFDVENVDNKVNDISIDVLNKYKLANEKLQQIAKNSEKFNAIYKTITTTLSVVTTYIAPWLELIIIFLPDIFNLFKKIAGNNSDESLKNKVNTEIIPQIVNKLRPEIQKSLMSMKNEMVQTATNDIQKLIDFEIEAIQNAKTDKDEKINEYDDELASVEKDIEIISNIIESLNLNKSESKN